MVIFDFFPVDRRALRGARDKGHCPSKILCCLLGREGGPELHFLLANNRPRDVAAENRLYSFALTVPEGEQPMDRVKSLSQRAALGFYAGMTGLALLSACSSTEGVLTSPPKIFAATQDRASVNSAQPNLHVQRSQSSLRHRPGANCGSPNERALLRVRALAHDEFWID